MSEHSFERLTTVQDPIMAERLVELLVAQNIDAMSRPGGAASSAAFAAMENAFWDILVDGSQLPKAQGIVTAALQTLEAEGAENAKAAEEEALAGPK